MSTDNIGQQLTDLKEQLGSIEKRFDRIDRLLDGVDRRFDAVDQELNAAKIRDEKAHELLKFSLEAREGLRESMETRFIAVEQKHDEEIALLKDVLHHVAGTRR